MRLIRVHVVRADTCGDLLDGLDVVLRTAQTGDEPFNPLCLIGPNGAGKSQFLQVLAEMFQSAFHCFIPEEERLEANPALEFEVEYTIKPNGSDITEHVLIQRKKMDRKKAELTISKWKDGQWAVCDNGAEAAVSLLPDKIVGYTSGDNETLSLPFLMSRSGYADEVYSQALSEDEKAHGIPDTRLMLVDYGTHLEVLVSNLLLAPAKRSAALLEHAKLKGLHSFRCIVQLAHQAAPRRPSKLKGKSKRKGIQLTAELEQYLDQLQRCSTCYQFDEKREKYVFDFLVTNETTTAFEAFWDSAISLYSAFHKLAMLNDLAIPKVTRRRFRKDTENRHFASRLPEPQDEDKVFRFERVLLRGSPATRDVDYVSLSDGEHQFAQILGTFAMISLPNVLFLLDEPESHFNPKWRVEFIRSLLQLPTAQGTREKTSKVSYQDCLLTTHAPFVPSDMRKNEVLIYSKDTKTNKIGVRTPEIETYGTTFDAILSECFGVHPPISQLSRDDIENLKESNDRAELEEGIRRLGFSVEKAILIDRLRNLPKS